MITEEASKPKITEVKSEESSNWWKAGTAKDNLKYDEYKPQAATATPKEENKFTRVQIEEDEDEEEQKDAELGKKLEESAGDLKKAEAKAREEAE